MEEIKKNRNINLLPKYFIINPKTKQENIELEIYPNNPVRLTIVHTLCLGASSVAITPVSTCTPNIRNPDKAALQYKKIGLK